jgi:uncharacterized membrane protein YcaP (DUF421 family)
MFPAARVLRSTSGSFLDMGTLIRAVLAYLFLLLVVRALSRRPGAQLTPFEFVIVFFIGGISIQAVVGDDRSMTNAVCTVITIGLLHRLISVIKVHWPKLGASIDGTPLVLLQKGQWQTDVMGRMRIQDTDVMAAARTKNLERLDQIEYAILERNGAISIIKAGGGGSD